MNAILVTQKELTPKCWDIYLKISVTVVTFNLSHNVILDHHVFIHLLLLLLSKELPPKLKIPCSLEVPKRRVNQSCIKDESCASTPFSRMPWKERRSGWPWEKSLIRKRKGLQMNMRSVTLWVSISSMVLIAHCYHVWVLADLRVNWIRPSCKIISEIFVHNQIYVITEQFFYIQYGLHSTQILCSYHITRIWTCLQSRSQWQENRWTWYE